MRNIISTDGNYQQYLESTGNIEGTDKQSQPGIWNLFFFLNNTKFSPTIAPFFFKCDAKADIVPDNNNCILYRNRALLNYPFGFNESLVNSRKYLMEYRLRIDSPKDLADVFMPILSVDYIIPSTYYQKKKN